MLTQWFDPEPGPASLPGTLAHGLAARGHDVQVVTGFPNYPTGRIAAGYRQRRRLDESWNGVRVRRVALYPSHDASGVRRLANYSSFAASSTVSGLDALRDVDVLWVNYSPVTIGLPMFVQQWKHRTPSVVHVLDLWPDTLFASRFVGDGQVSRTLHAGLGWWCRAMYDRAHTVAHISPGVGDVLQRRGVPAHKLQYAPMWADESVFRPRPAARGWGLGPDTVAIAYAGTMGRAQDLTTLLKACARVADLDLRCLIAGSGVDETTLRKLAKQEGAANVDFLGRLGAAEVAQLMAVSDLQYVGLNDHPLARITMPSKVQAILASARPIAGSLVGDAADVVQRAGGWTVAPGDVSGLVGALRAASEAGRAGLSSLGRRARVLYEQEFGMTRGIDRIEAILAEAAEAP